MEFPIYTGSLAAKQGSSREGELSSSTDLPSQRSERYILPANQDVDAIGVQRSAHTCFMQAHAPVSRPRRDLNPRTPGLCYLALFRRSEWHLVFETLKYFPVGSDVFHLIDRDREKASYKIVAQEATIDNGKGQTRMIHLLAIPKKGRFQTRLSSLRSRYDNENCLIGGRLDSHYVKLKRKQSSRSSPRFKKAFAKALSVRSKVLGRRLTRAEWIQLKKAVAKQISVATDELSTTVRYLLNEVHLLKKQNPSGAKRLDDSISMFHQQVSVMRQELMSLHSEKDRLTENCPHFQLRKMFSPIKPINVYIEERELPTSIQVKIESTIQLCCKECLQDREDALFSWYGITLDNLPVPDELKLKSRAFAKQISCLKPLSIQNVWTQLVTARYRSTF
nr:MAG: hypothetical protein [Trichoderma harzianum partitivirus 3]